MKVQLPYGSPVNIETEVVGDEWTYGLFDQTGLSGTYDVYFSIEGQLIAQDFFEVSEG